jgi:hypothetical protein
MIVEITTFNGSKQWNVIITKMGFKRSYRDVSKASIKRLQRIFPNVVSIEQFNDQTKLTCTK